MKKIYVIVREVSYWFGSIASERAVVAMTLDKVLAQRLDVLYRKRNSLKVNPTLEYSLQELTSVDGVDDRLFDRLYSRIYYEVVVGPETLDLFQGSVKNYALSLWG